MFSISFKRFGNGIYISHTDVLRSLNRTMRRAEIVVAYSNGFNRHMALKLSQPLPLGIESEDEWVTINVLSDITKEEFLDKFNKNCPPFLQAKEIYETPENPSLAGKITGSEYFIRSEKAIGYKKEIEELKAGCVITIRNKDGVKEKEVSDLLYGIEVTNEGIQCTAAFGNVNLRMDAFSEHLNEKFGLGIRLTDIVRKAQLIKKEEKFITVSEYMKGLV